MKIAYKATIFLLVILLNSFFFQEDTLGRITYKVSLNIPKERIDAFEKESKKNGENTEVISILKNSKAVNSILEFNNKNSYYYLPNELENDFKNKEINFVKTRAGGNKVYYSEKENNSINIFEQDCKLGECFLIKNDSHNWELFKESKIIGKYKCYKATLNKKTTFWYTTEIPTSFGPKNFSGLPGAILEIQDGYFSFIATNIELNLKNEDVSIKKPKGEIIAKEKYEKMLRKAFPEFYNEN